MGYNLFDPTEDDDEDKLTRAMRERFLQSDRGELSAPDASLQPDMVGRFLQSGSGQLSAPDASLQPEAVGRFLSQRAPEADQAPPYPIPQREQADASQYIIPILAGAADLLVGQRGPNGRRVTGQNIGNIAQSAVNARDAERQRGDKNFELDRKAYLEQGEGQNRKDAIKLAGRNADLRQLELDASNAHAKAVQERFMMGLDSPEAKQANLEHQQAQTRLLEAQRLQQMPGEDGLTSEQRERGKDRDADRTARGQIAADNLAQRKLQAEAIAAQRAETARIAGETRNKADATKFLDKTEEERSQAQALKGVEAVTQKYEGADDLPGAGKLDSVMPAWVMHPFDPEQRQDADTIKKQLNQAAVYFRHEVTGASGTPREDAIHKAIKGLDGTEEEMLNALRFWKEDLQGKIKTRASLNPEASRAALEEQGLGQWTYGDEQPRAAPPPPAAGGQLPPMGARNPTAVDVGAAGRGRPSGGSNYGYEPMPAPNPPMGARFDGRPDTSGDLSDMQNQNLGVTGQPPMVPLVPELEEKWKQRGIIFRGGQ